MKDLLEPQLFLSSYLLCLIPYRVQLLLPLLLGYLEIAPIMPPPFNRESDLLTLDTLFIFSSINDSLELFDFFKYGLWNLSDTFEFNFLMHSYVYSLVSPLILPRLSMILS
jgi:hypothetical protein